jgi:hypothetical protein
MGLSLAPQILLAAALLALPGDRTDEGLALLIEPGGLVSLKDFAISVADPPVAKDGKTFAHHGRTYPYGGPYYWTRLRDYTRTMDVARHIEVDAGDILFDHVKMQVGCSVVRVEQAVQWGDLVAGLAVIQHEGTSFRDPDRAHALIVLSPQQAKGGCHALTLVGKIDYTLYLVRPKVDNR